ncbi:MAG: hypothetical protein IKZ88_07605 [Neisseriaceae bacterium]|nr:hypothetical protein [Neisseriaceae bacterium]
MPTLHMKYILPLYCILPLRWVENPPYNKTCGFAVGWKAHPISTCGAFGGLKQRSA